MTYDKMASIKEAVCDVNRLPPTVFHIILKLWISYHYVSNDIFNNLKMAQNCQPCHFSVSKDIISSFQCKLSILKESNALLNSVILYVP